MAGRLVAINKLTDIKIKNYEESDGNSLSILVKKMA